MKKGFTLIELLGVIVVLSVVLIIAVPRIQESISTSRDKSYDLNVKQIESAAKLYVYENLNQFTGGVSFTVSVTTLCTDKYLTCPINNPKDGTTMDGSVIITKNENDEFTYVYTEE
jgi:prepilin-type N-terminal cleavage/methylation domain-containing protein